MPSRVANAVFAYVMDFITIIDSDYFSTQVAHALETKVLSIIDWDIIPKVVLIDDITTLVRRESPVTRRLVARTLDKAFRRVCGYHAIFTAMLDQCVGPSFLCDLSPIPVEPQGPKEEVLLLLDFGQG